VPLGLIPTHELQLIGAQTKRLCVLFWGHGE